MDKGGVTMYLSYEEYQNMGGTLDETAFNDFEFEAECIVNWYTFDRLKNETEYPVELQRCMYALIKMAKLKSDSMNLGQQTTQTTDSQGNVTTVTVNAAIASQSNDGVSVSYNTVQASAVFEKLSPRVKGGEIDNTIKMYLWNVTNSLGQKVLYRGLYSNE